MKNREARQGDSSAAPLRFQALVNSKTSMNEQELAHLITSIYSDLTNLALVTTPERPMHLAHYTTLEVLENIMTDD